MSPINALIATGGGYRPPDFDLQTAQGNALRNDLMRGELQAQPRRLDAMDQEMRLRQLALDIKAKALEAQGSPNPISLDYEWGTVSGAPDKVAYVADMVAQYPGDAMNDPDFMPWVASQGVNLKRKEAAKPSPYGKEALDFADKKAQIEAKYRKDEPKTLDIETWVTPSGQTVNLQKGQMPPAGSVPFKGKGMDLQFDPETGRLISMTQGGMLGAGPTTKTKGAMEEQIISGKEQLARMQAIQSEFKPEYLETGTRLKASWTGIKAKLGKDVDSEDAKKLGDFKKFQRKAIENINKYIKEFTGAQMSEQEANRLRLAQPDPGEHWWQGDDPITFKAKMDDILKASRAAVARWEYYRTMGLSDAEIKGIVKSGSGISLEKLTSSME